MGLVVKNRVFSILLAGLLAAPAFGARPGFYYCWTPYSLIGTANEPKEEAILKYLESNNPSGSGLFDSGSLEPAHPADANLNHVDVPLANVSLVSLAQIGSETSRARALSAPFDPFIDYKRLVHPRHWAQGLKDHPEAPWKVYDLQTLNDWRLGEAFVRDDAEKTALGPELLKKLHTLTARHITYPDYEARRIKVAYKKGAITYERARLALLEIEEGKSFTGKDHAELAGLFRTEAPDTLSNTGDEWGEHGRYFTGTQLERYRQNPYFHVGEWTVKQIGPDKFRLWIQMPAPRDVVRLVDEAYARAQRDLASAKTDELYIAAVLKLEHALISIHPFIDGNGRSIRLQSDLLFRRRGIPPPLYPKDGDFTATPDELYQTTLQGVRAYVAEKSP